MGSFQEVGIPYGQEVPDRIFDNPSLTSNKPSGSLERFAAWSINTGKTRMY